MNSLIFTIIFSLGIAFQKLLKVSFLHALVLVIIFLFLSFITLNKKYTAIASFVILVLALGMLRLSAFQFIPKNHISNFTDFYINPTVVTGEVSNILQSSGNQTMFVLEAESIQFNTHKYETSGKTIILYRGSSDVNNTERLVLKGKFLKQYKKTKVRQYNERSNAIFLVNGPLSLKKLDPKYRFSFVAFCQRLKTNAQKIVSSKTTPLTAAVLNAMLLGERKGLPVLISKNMMKSGTVHILVVSGFNVGLFAYLAVLLLKIVRIRFRSRIIIVSLLLVLYCFISGASNPVVRATIMAIFVMLGFFLKRDAGPLSALAFSALSILVYNPIQLFDLGFQLSFMSVLSIVCIYPKLKAVFNKGPSKITFFRWLFSAGLVSLSAWIGTFLLIAINFRMISPITVFANIIIVPLATLITLNGACLLIVSLIFAPLSVYLAASCQFLVFLLVYLNNILIKIPGAYFKF